MYLSNDARYIVYQKFDISHIAKRLRELDGIVWKLDEHRQAYGNGPHHRTNSIILNYCRGEPEFDKQLVMQNKITSSWDTTHGTDINAWVHRTESDFIQDVKNIEKKTIDNQLNLYTDLIVDELEKKFNGVAGLVLYVNLPAGQNILDHKDGGYYLSVVHRLHIPIITNPNVSFIIGDTKFHMEEGNLYEINNQQRHAVCNSSDMDRVHLIIDIIPKDKYPG